jgi:hypothetical protein
MSTPKQERQEEEEEEAGHPIGVRGYRRRGRLDPGPHTRFPKFPPAVIVLTPKSRIKRRDTVIK